MNKKAIAYLLAGSLLIGGTFVGTKAWFSDVGTADNSLILTMGSFYLDIIENKDIPGNPKGWVHYRYGKAESIETEENGSSFINVKPGDQFIRTVTFKNTGTLDQRVKLDLSNFKAETPNGFTLDMNMGVFPEANMDGITYTDVKGGQEVSIKMSIIVTKEMQKEGYSGQEFNMNIGNIVASSKKVDVESVSKINITK